MKVAIVHDLLTQMGGAERVVETLHEMYPQAPIYTLAMNRDILSERLRHADIRTTWVQHVPGVTRNFKKLLPLYPVAVRDIPLSGYDVVISSSFAFVKGVRVPRGTYHLCYCYTPMRFAWDFESYIMRDSYPAWMKSLARGYVRYLKHWDVKTAGHVDQFIAISSVVRQRIQACYRRQADVIFPPVATSRFTPSAHIGNYYLIVSRLVSYKRIDLAVEAFTRLGVPLYIAGDGPDRKRLQEMAGSNVTFLGRMEDAEISRLMAQCRGLLFPGEEDFGITPLEAGAAGRPVIAYGGGGALDTIKPYVNGLFFRKQDPASVMDAVKLAEHVPWNTETIVRHARQFDESVFKRKFGEYVNAAYHEYKLKECLG